MEWVSMRVSLVLVGVLVGAFAQQPGEKPPASVEYKVAFQHEIKPHRRTIPMEGMDAGFNQLRLTLTVSPTGEVIDAEAGGDAAPLKHWAELKDEVMNWKFTPFEVKGKAVTAEVEEYIDLVPPERLPKRHVVAPKIGPDSKVEITLERTECLGTCPGYSVTVSTMGTVFEGRSFVVAAGKHAEKVNADEVRGLAKKFVSADFYSMDEEYVAGVTDNPTYELTISIDGRKKKVTDYVGEWVGMPAVIRELEDEVDAFARTDRWIRGKEGMVPALREEKFNFESFEAQVMVKEAAMRGETRTVQELLDAGVSLEPKPAPKVGPEEVVPFEGVGWLTAASGNAETLQIFISASASKKDQNDKDLALADAAERGSLEGVRALIEYGANPNVDLGKLTVVKNSGGMTMEGPGKGSVLMYAARSGNPELVREILNYHPNLDVRDSEGQTVLFAASEYTNEDSEDGRVECVKLLVAAGADVNAHDENGNTPLHETFLHEVEEELLKLGADVNARNSNGETPIFTTVDDSAMQLFIRHGADLTIRNNKGETVFEAAKAKGPTRQEALRKAIEAESQP
jgi:Domain of unknown function (DUF6438)/Ankyrin repeats (3 copies)